MGNPIHVVARVLADQHQKLASLPVGIHWNNATPHEKKPYEEIAAQIVGALGLTPAAEKPKPTKPDKPAKPAAPAKPDAGAQTEKAPG